VGKRRLLSLLARPHRMKRLLAHAGCNVIFLLALWSPRAFRACTPTSPYSFPRSMEGSAGSGHHSPQRVRLPAVSGQFKLGVDHLVFRSFPSCGSNQLQKFTTTFLPTRTARVFRVECPTGPESLEHLAEAAKVNGRAPDPAYSARTRVSPAGLPRPPAQNAAGPLTSFDHVRSMSISTATAGRGVGACFAPDRWTGLVSSS